MQFALEVTIIECSFVKHSQGFLGVNAFFLAIFLTHVCGKPILTSFIIIQYSILENFKMFRKVTNLWNYGVLEFWIYGIMELCYNNKKGQ
jgi:hypothetical protein